MKFADCETCAFKLNPRNAFPCRVCQRDNKTSTPDYYEAADERSFTIGMISPNNESSREALGEQRAQASTDYTAGLLAERGNRYGEFKDQAVYADDINLILHRSPNWDKMSPDQREGLRLIANKIGRILNGDPDYHDSWDDIAGYARLVGDRLRAATSSS